MRCSSARAVRSTPHSILTASLLIVTSGVIGGCGMAPGQNGITTASLRPTEPLVQKSYSPYAPASTIGAAMPRPATPPRQAAASAVPRTFKTYQYQWNGNRERIKTGGALTPAHAAAPITTASINAPRQDYRSAPRVTWKASPAAPERSAAAVASPGGNDIVVAPGDTLYSISSKHHVPMASLMQANHMTSPVVRASQHLILPAASR